MRMALHWIARLLGVLVVTLFAAEAALRVYASHAAKPAGLFRSDPETGWRNAPNLLTTLVNAAAEEWSIRTDENGQRVIPQVPGARRKMLILGDSLSFGEGIDVKDRFDVRMLPFVPDTRVINTGTMGYGTEQEYAVFRNWKQSLEPGDTILIVLNESDYFDVLRRRFVGRAKPYIERHQSSFDLRPPSIGLWEHWSDWSLLARAAAKVFDQLSSEPASESFDPRQSIEIISFILSRIREEAPEDVKVILAHQGTRNFLGPKFGLSSMVFCQFAHACIDLDDVMADPAHLLPDGHWSASGHATVAQALLKVLSH
jgi:hypothetical protein